FIALIKVILSKFPNIYNKNILILTNLSHRFLGYKNLLYMLSLLLAGAMFFVGFSYSMYNSTREIVRDDNPFDIMFIEDSEFNKTKKEDVEEIISTEGAKIEKYNVLEFLELPMFIYEDDKLSLYNDTKVIISETNYNKHMNTTVDIKPKEGFFITIFNEKMEHTMPTSILTNMNKKQIEEIPRNPNDYSRDVNTFKKVLKDTIFIHIPDTSISSEKNVPFTNYRYTQAFYTGAALVLDDSDYELFKNNLPSTSLKNMHLLNLKNGDKAFESLLTHLRNINNLDNSYWKNVSAFGKTSYDEKGFKEAYRPMYIEELIKLQIDNNGIVFFTMLFIGLLFVIANGIVLYYKVLCDIEEEKERIISLRRIGILQKEIKSIISKELAIIFFVPIIIGGGMGLYYLYVILSNTGMIELLIKKSFVILIGGILIQIIFYFISRRKYFKDVL
ncbi:ABC transporter permease, partial [Clostridium tarantellae]|uniref:ABC transporter permease n=1 Tax=Clostridium tarantellae TaxID=39493 RepID=UPI0014788BB4